MGTRMQLYTGPERLVVSIDLGTTMSAVAYAHLIPSNPPDVRVVCRWPGQPQAAGDCKVPSLVAYRNGQAVAFGAEAEEYAESDDHVEIARWFKLHLHPDSMKRPRGQRLEIPALPQEVGIIKVYSDMLRWLMDQTKRYFERVTPTGNEIWQRLESTIVIILAIPNGWELPQQHRLREAIVQAGVLPRGFGEGRLKFVSEGESSIHYALQHINDPHWLREGTMFALTDAGGSTVDSTLYICKKTAPDLQLEEARGSECVQAGSVFVDRAMRTLLERRLAGSRFGGTHDIAEMCKDFSCFVKRQFGDQRNEYSITFGSLRDNDQQFNISRGRLRLSRDEIEQAFSGVVTAIEESCSELLSNREVKYLLLVGGFAESMYLRRRLNDTFERREIQIITVDEPTRKAAAEGAVIWYIKELVRARAARYTLGIKCSGVFDINNPLHRERASCAFQQLDGELRLPSCYSVLIKKDDIARNDQAIVRSYYQLSTSRAGLDAIWTQPLFAYHGSDVPVFTTDEEGNPRNQFRKICDLEADLSDLIETLQVQLNMDTGINYYRLNFQVAIFFGGTTLQGRLQWHIGGQLRVGPLTIIPNFT